MPIWSRPPYCTMETRPINQIDEVMAAAKRAKEAGSTRFCMGAAWRELGNKKKAFNNILDMVRTKAFAQARRGECACPPCLNSL